MEQKKKERNVSLLHPGETKKEEMKILMHLSHVKERKSRPPWKKRKEGDAYFYYLPKKEKRIKGK